MTEGFHKPIFIIGLHRTGSTLLKNILNNSREVSMAIDEMHLISPWKKDVFNYYYDSGDINDDKNVSNFLDVLFSGKTEGSFWIKIKDIGFDENKIRSRIMNSNRSMKQIIAIILEEYAKSERKKRYGVKYPLHFSKLSVLLEWWPQCKIIHLTRDPRAICASKLNDKATRFRKKRAKVFSPIVHFFTLIFFCFEYYWSSRIHRKFHKHRNYVKVRYEDIVIDPEGTMKKISEFCDIDYNPLMLDVMGKESSYNIYAKKGIDVNRITNWKNHLSLLDNLLVSHILRNSMEQLGYHQIDIDNGIY
jgi:hypothetical protein